MRVLVAACVAGLLAAALPAAAQVTIHFTDEAGPAPGGGDTCISQKGWLLGDLPDEGKAYMSATSNGLGCATGFTYTVVEPFTTAGPFDIQVEYDCDTPTIVGSSPATSGTRFTLYHNGESLGQVTNGVFEVCTGSAIADGARIGAADLVFAAGDVIRLDILWWGSDFTGPSQSLHVVAAASSITVPVVEVPAGPDVAEAVTHYVDLTEAAFTHAFANATSDAYVLNFTTDAPAGVVDVVVDGTGYVNATLLDGNGSVVFNGTLATSTLELTNVTVGAWQIALQYDQFVGNVSFSYAAVLAEPTGNTTVDGNETLDGTLPDESTPLPALLVVAALVAAARRRR